MNEVSFANTLFKNVPAKSPLFIERKKSIEKLANNLKILDGKNNSDKIEAGLNDLDNALKAMKSKDTIEETSLKSNPEAKNDLILQQFVARIQATVGNCYIDSI